ncbi:MAG: hypothetical protein DKM50_09325 [Candidatus Margulisiibacteriota bacterium]|nr:MAG: hypothetical protein A2X43_02215 [Candidatus Margulisbacteria bacterium GWD2_39_127]OGI00889.1 MAG: hypothetical protein A2X42_03090 [Candidatus Margulisbacteria bacterium GWF2_38_17]OGI08744.1 MAG: hypothetical protein A2X41_05345 [Candidatus Margulisbacteria bacterium GWE2_39_32]PZM79455.1 MAG: hypothetical protein DKM50_09325 [Candidatus Margulisiibacteriota bacterium]HAR63491.1 hypothetical protein [Candidatus Margulisiibacteriota bacterium]
MKIKFNHISQKFEEFISDIDMSFFIEQAEKFMKQNLNENMTEDEAIEFLETSYLFNEKKGKTDILVAADILRAIRMIKYHRDNIKTTQPVTSA